MDQLKEIFQKYLDMSDSERVGIARNMANEVLSYAQTQGLSDQDAATFIILLFRLFVSADKNTGNDEYNFFLKVTGTTVSYDDYFDAVNYGSASDFVASSDALIDGMPQDVKNATLIFGLCILACDGRLTISEQELFLRLLA